MWPFKRKDLLWKPKYVNERDLVPKLGEVVLMLPQGMNKSNMATDQARSLPHKLTKFVDFGPQGLEIADCGRYGIESLFGLFSVVHWPGYCDHWWCRTDLPLSLIAEFYFWSAGEYAESRDYIGAYLWQSASAEEDNEDFLEVVSEDRPSMKFIIHPCEDGSVHITKGFINHDDPQASAGDQGRLDMNTAESISVFPRRIPLTLAEQYPDHYQGWPIFQLMRRESKWYVGIGVQTGENKWRFSGGGLIPTS